MDSDYYCCIVPEQFRVQKLEKRFQERFPERFPERFQERFQERFRERFRELEQGQANYHHHLRVGCSEDFRNTSSPDCCRANQ